jgi:hypothetical protein
MQKLYYSWMKYFIWKAIPKDNMFNSLIPKTHVFGLVESTAYNGAYNRNLFNFQNFTVTSVAVSVKGEEIHFRPIPPSYAATTPRFIEAYSTLFSGTRKMYYNTGKDILQQDYPNGYTVYAFVLTPDMCGSSTHFNMVGNLCIE